MIWDEIEMTKKMSKKMRFYFITTRLEKLRNLTISKVDKDVE